MRLISAVFFLFVFTGYAFAIERPTEFRGVQWRTPIENIGGLEYDSKDNENEINYTKQNDDLKIAGESVNKITYKFIDGSFVGVHVEFSDFASKSIYNLLYTTYGSPSSMEKIENGAIYNWRAYSKDEANITLMTTKNIGMLDFRIKTKGGSGL